MTKITNERLETFCDGIFAIAITLLILEIKIPEIDHINSTDEIRNALYSQWPSWFAFFQTFIILLIAWVNHHYGLRQVDKTSSAFIYANGFLMLTVIVFPYSTGVLGRFLNTEFSTFPVVLYCLTNLIHALAWLTLAISTLHPKNLSKNLSSFRLLKKSIKLTFIGFFFNLSMTILAFWYPLFALIMVTGAWIVYSLIGVFLIPYELKYKD